MQRSILLVALVGIVASGATYAVDVPVAVSPGDASKLVLVESRCPTFNWGSVEGASSFELVVYRLGSEGGETEAVLRRTLPGSVNGWTPSLDQCLEGGGSYGWSVRATGLETVSAWSVPRLFRVVTGPSKMEFEAALQAVRRHLATEGDASAEATAEAGAESIRESSQENSRNSLPTPAAAATELSVDGGVEATSFTGDGSMLTGLNPANLASAIAIAQGGTGASDAGTALSNLGGAPTTHTHTEADITDLTHTLDTNTFCTVFSNPPNTITISCPGGSAVTFMADYVQTSGCPEGMARVEGFCVDRWEAHLSGASPYEVPTAGTAVSSGSAIPQGYISATVASSACQAAGKRLCTSAEWLRACQGPSGWVYPYGNTHVADACNDHRDVHPVIEVFGEDATWSGEELNDPRLNQLEDSLDPTGENLRCVSVEGVYDLIGNLEEWIFDPSGTFKGGNYVEATLNGPGCSNTTTAHTTEYHDFRTGFRCCTDPL